MEGDQESYKNKKGGDLERFESLDLGLWGENIFIYIYVCFSGVLFC